MKFPITALQINYLELLLFMATFCKYWFRAVHPRPSHWSSHHPTVVDIVYLWCDETDPAWAAKRALAARSAGIPTSPGIPACSMDELKYSLRSVCKYFPNHNAIWLINDGQIPDWLNTSHPKINLIDQNDLLDQEAVKPCYNSLAIESYFHTIGGLAEHFLYFNDDFFLCRTTTIDDWFDGAGRLRLDLGRWLNPSGKTRSSDNPGDANGQRNSTRLLDTYYRREFRLTLKHRPYTARKSLLSEAHLKFPAAFRETRKSQFRSEQMYTLLSGLIPYMAYYTNRAVLNIPSILIKDMYFWSSDTQKNFKTWRRIEKHRDKAFCIQEDRRSTLSREAIHQFHEMMNAIFPHKSPYEI